MIAKGRVDSAFDDFFAFDFVSALLKGLTFIINCQLGAPRLSVQGLSSFTTRLDGVSLGRFFTTNFTHACHDAP